jgi:lysophospholipase L1-like esterase
MHQIITGIQGANPNAKLVFLTPLRRYGFKVTEEYMQLLHDTMPNEVGHTLAEYREAIFNKCAMHGISVIDTYTISGFDFSEGQDGIHSFDENAVGKSPWTVDGLHPNTEGHLELARRILPYLEDILSFG